MCGESITSCFGARYKDRPQIASRSVCCRSLKRRSSTSCRPAFGLSPSTTTTRRSNTLSPSQDRFSTTTSRSVRARVTATASVVTHSATVSLGSPDGTARNVSSTLYLSPTCSQHNFNLKFLVKRVLMTWS